MSYEERIWTERTISEKRMPIFYWRNSKEDYGYRVDEVQNLKGNRSLKQF